MVETTQIRRDLYLASLTLTNLNLFHAAKWCSEALNGLVSTTEPFDFLPPPLLEDEQADQFQLLLAKNYFNCKEFLRASRALQNCRSGNGYFFKLYSLYISLDKQVSEELDGILHLNPKSVVQDGDGEDFARKSLEVSGEVKKTYVSIILDAENFMKEHGQENSFLLYLLGIIYNRKSCPQEAQKNLARSLELFPYNWSCWQELFSTFTSYNDVTEFSELIRNSSSILASSVMFQMFELVALQEFYQQQPVFEEKLTQLSTIFPKFSFLDVQKFLVAYHRLDYYLAESIFDDILLNDPMRLDDLDTYSNMLYVMEKKSKLSYLAQYASHIDKFRSETCCVIANYHSMKGEHDKSIMYYIRALTLNKNCLSAWTLMGHEFVEIKNSHAAIESYRRAVDINPKDFRAWYGLGQAYEVLDMHLYALYFYQKATNLQPTDKRMWQAIGNCFEKIDKLEEAIQSFEKALAIDNSNKLNDGSVALSAEPHICYKLAVISDKLGRQRETYKYMRLCFEQELEWGITDEISKARLWLARHALESKRFEEAYELAKEFHLTNANSVEEARAIAKEARSRMIK
ncbi:hypothetical protein PUMCH_001510 [Australozyma saopauloensis]|uniref:Cdc23 domain-containing protein n=1 Tax=Australozyma saopauloensis TaxID=291208 RepID=A0AAX4H702_9ASCO|nr:hypothetical protein PUMCH_001510 [[Candida] saopauloensis]